MELFPKLYRSLFFSALLAPAFAWLSWADGMSTDYGGLLFHWTGFYLGVNSGGAWTDRHIRTGGFGPEIADGTTSAQARLNWSPSFNGGVQLGYNGQFCSAVESRNRFAVDQRLRQLLGRFH